MKYRAILAAIVILAGAALQVGIAAADTEFLAYEGRDAVQEGQGGSKKVVDGLDFWMEGSPPRRFQVLGTLIDERWRSGIYGLVQVSKLEHDIAKRARAAGGDAVIITNSENNDWGVASYSTGEVHAYGTRATRYVVVKYLPGEPSSSPTPAMAAPFTPQASPAAIVDRRTADAPSAALSTIDQSVPMERQAGVFVVPVLINGAIQLKFAVDSGASDVNIPADVFLTLVRTGTIQTSDYLGTQTYTLADGSAVPSNVFRIRTLQVGDVRLENVVASVGDPRGPLLLGQSFLSRFSSWSINNEGPSLILRTVSSAAPRSAAVVAQSAPPPATASVQAPPAGTSAPRTPCGMIQKDDGMQLVPCHPSRSAVQ